MKHENTHLLPKKKKNPKKYACVTHSIFMDSGEHYKIRRLGERSKKVLGRGRGRGSGSGGRQIDEEKRTKRVVASRARKVGGGGGEKLVEWKGEARREKKPTNVNKPWNDCFAAAPVNSQPFLPKWFLRIGNYARTKRLDRETWPWNS